ncbi:MAG TPA: type II toxin-antitoxin system Phd/YefM family antitoxin [Spirochaetota bacterium]|nr:type II toxin-antitoxin system Phd/YefM family antitoxin [Spirochaetota bacterium]
MKFITVRDFRARPSAVWKELKKEHELVITNNGKPIALLTPLSDENLEERLRASRKARAEEALRAIRKKASAEGTDGLSMDEISSEISEFRKST